MPRVISLFAVVLVAACQVTVSPAVVTTTSAATVPVPVLPSPTLPSPTLPSQAPMVSLPDPGGTCTERDIALVGMPITGSGFGDPIIDRDVDVLIRLTNVGSDCVVVLPKVVGVASSTGQVEAARVLNGGTTYRAHAGAIFTFILGAWWPSSRPGPAASPCATFLDDVVRADLPLANGTIRVTLPTTFHFVCSSPPTMSINVQST